MEFLIEELIDLILEGSIEISKSKKVPKWIRYPLIGLIILIFTVVILGVLILGLLLLAENILAGLVISVIGIIMLVMGIINFKKVYLTKISKKNGE